MPDSNATQDKFNGTCDLILSLTPEETAAWRRMAPRRRQALIENFGENLTGVAPRFEDAVQPVGRDPASREAAEKAKPKFTAQVRRVFYAIQRAGEDGLTDEEGQERMVISGNSYRPARGALVKLCLVARSGGFRATRAGNNANIWVTISEPPEEGD